MTRLRIACPTDPLEARRLADRLLRCGVLAVELDQGYVDTDDLVLIDAARDGVLDRFDTIPTPLAAAACADDLLEVAVAQIADARAALEAPTATDLSASFRRLAITLRELNEPSRRCAALSDSSRQALEAYRAAASALVDAMDTSFTLSVVSPGFVTDDLATSARIAAAHASVDAPTVTLSGGLVKCEWNFVLFGMTWASGDCVTTDSTFTLSRRPD